jgi:hypothetical protein
VNAVNACAFGAGTNSTAAQDVTNTARVMSACATRAKLKKNAADVNLRMFIPLPVAETKAH